jgi:hypothetical protein
MQNVGSYCGHCIMYLGEKISNVYHFFNSKCFDDPYKFMTLI